MIFWRRTGTRLALDTLNCLKTGIIKTDVSDHLPIYVISEKPDVEIYTEKTIIYKRKINENSINNFNNRISETKWDTVYEHNTANDGYEAFLKIFLYSYEKEFPKIKINIKTKNLLSPWMTKGLLKSSKKKQNYTINSLKRKRFQMKKYIKPIKIYLKL